MVCGEVAQGRRRRNQRHRSASAGVALTISTVDGEMIFDGTNNAPLRLVQPNDPGCDGEKFTGPLVASGTSSLSPANL